MNRNNFLKIFILSIVSVLFLAACNSDDKGKSEAGGETADGEYPKMSLRLGHLATEHSNYHELALRFKEIVEEKSDGNVTVSVFPHRQLGGDRELMEAMQINTLDLGIITVSPVSNFVPEFFVHDLPFIFHDLEHVQKYVKSDVAQDILAETEKAGLKSMNYMIRGYQALGNTKRAIEKPEDMKGLKIRVIESPFYVKGFQALGSNVVSMNFAESFTALQQGAIDGIDNTIDVIHDENLYESIDYISKLQVNYAFGVVMASKGLFEGWPENVQQLVLEASQQASDEVNEKTPQVADEYEQKLADYGIKINDVDRDLFRPLVDDVYAEYVSQYGDDYLNRIEALANE